MITVVGLGLKKNDITLSAADAIESADKVFIKTVKTSTYDYFTSRGIAVESFDEVYDNAESFDALDGKIIEILTAASKKGKVVFCVNGNGADDSTVCALSKKTEIEIIAGVGHADCGLALSPDTSVSSYSAYDVVAGKTFMPDKRHTVIIREIDNRFLASDLKLILQNVYGDDKNIKLINNAKVTDMTVSDLDKQNNYDYSTACVLSAESFLTAKRHDFNDLIEIMEGLLSDDGCPWDRAQTHESIRINLIEEAYELVDAIDKGDLDNMIEESGDVLLQAVFHCMIGKCDGEYDYNDALSMLCNKLIFRHTHIFGQNKAANAEEALKCWNAAKNIEKDYHTLSEKMAKVPKNLPALLYAEKIQKIAVKCGFDWPDIAGTFDKLDEEIAELKSATADEAVCEAGDVLFSAINPMRWMKIEPELALKTSCDKFVKRFTYMENTIIDKGLDISDFATREKYWAEAKKLYK